MPWHSFLVKLVCGSSTAITYLSLILNASTNLNGVNSVSFSPVSSNLKKCRKRMNLKLTASSSSFLLLRFFVSARKEMFCMTSLVVLSVSAYFLFARISTHSAKISLNHFLDA